MHILRSLRFYIITDPVSYGFLIPVTVYFRDRGDAFKNHRESYAGIHSTISYFTD